MQAKVYVYNGIQTPYEIYDDGRCYSLRANKFLTPYVNGSGYLYVSLYVSGYPKGIRKAIHQLVAETYVPNPEHKKTVNHIDGDKTNNSASNLEWCSSSEQNYHAYRTGLHTPVMGEDVHFAKYSEKSVIQACELMSNGVRPLEAADITGIPVKMIYEIRLKHTWKHISTKYTFPKLKYGRSNIWPNDFKMKIEELILAGNSNLEIFSYLNIPVHDKRTRKMVSDMRYRLTKVQRLGSNAVDA